MITKRDSATLSLDLHQKFRRRGYKKFDARSYDTSFLVKYSPGVYETLLNRIEFINCDRFIDSKRVTDFYVKTPNFDGARVLVYFKNLNAFMPAVETGKGFKVGKVPPNEKVCLIAVGRDGDDFYYTKTDFTIDKKATVDMKMEKVSYDDMKKMFTILGYEK